MDPQKKPQRRSHRKKRKRLLYVEENEFGFGAAAHYVAFLLVALILVYLLVRLVV